jgi:hypothetical protein
MSRADVPDRVVKILPNFYLYVDEFQNFANASFADILSEARKYKLNLTIAHQYIEQMDEIVRPAVFGNVGTMIAFRVGATDAEVLEKEFAPVFVLEDLVNLGFAQIYLKLMIDGLSSQPFSATTLPPIPHPEVAYMSDIIASSRKLYSRPKEEVEKTIIAFHEEASQKTKLKGGKNEMSEQKSVQKMDDKRPSNDKQYNSNSDPKPIISVTKLELDLPKPADVEHMIAKTENKNPAPILPKNNEQPRPVSLSSLNKKPKVDNKIQSQGNMNALKDALSKVLAKAKENHPEKSVVETKKEEKKNDSDVANAMNNANPLPRSFEEVNGQVKQSSNTDNRPKEIPEDVLRNVLNG